MTELRFFDTNILLYLYDKRDPGKRTRAVETFRECLEAQTLVISTQVVQEFYAAATRKLGLDLVQAQNLVIKQHSFCKLIQLCSGEFLFSILR